MQIRITQLCLQQRRYTSCVVHALMAWMSRSKRRDGLPLQQGLLETQHAKSFCSMAAVTDKQTHWAHFTECPKALLAARTLEQLWCMPKGQQRHQIERYGILLLFAKIFCAAPVWACVCPAVVACGCAYPEYTV